MTQSKQTQNNAGAVVIDTNILLAVCSKEPGEATAKAALSDYTVRNWVFYGPGAILTKGLFILCRKLLNKEITEAIDRKAIEEFNDYMSAILLSPQGGKSCSCLHSADGFSLALTEELAKSGPAEFLTFDKRVVNVVAKNAPSVKVNLLPS